MNWNDLPDVPATGTASSWDELPDAGQQTGIGEALGSGALQGLTFGFADEAIGAVKGALDPKKTIKEAVEAERAHKKILEEEHPVATTIGDVAGSLLPTAVSIAATAATAGAASPAAAVTGAKTGASLGLLGARLAAKTGLKAAAKGAAKEALKDAVKAAPAVIEKTGAQALIGTVKKGIVSSAAQGAAAGVGYSDAIASDDPEAAQRAIASGAMGAALGAGIHAALPIAGAAVKGIAKGGAKKAASAISGVSEEAQEYYLKHAPAVRAGKTYTEIATDAKNEIVKDLKTSQAFSQAAKNTLDEAGHILIKKESATAPLMNAIKTATDTLAGSDKAKIVNELEKHVADVEQWAANNAGYIPARRVKTLLDSLGSVAKYGGELHGLSREGNTILQDARREVDKIVVDMPAHVPPSQQEQAAEFAKRYADNIKGIKGAKGETLQEGAADIMKRTEDIRKIYQSRKGGINVKKLFSDIASLGRMQAGDVAKDIDKLRGSDTALVLSKYMRDKGIDIDTIAKNTAIKKEFEKMTQAGSKNTLYGATFGTAIGGVLSMAGLPPQIAIPVAALIGSSLGQIKDKYGTRVFRYVLDLYLAGKGEIAAVKVPATFKAAAVALHKTLKVIKDVNVRQAVVNNILHSDQMKQEQAQPIASTPQGAQYAFEQVAR
jgi:hypothetical protein